MMSGYIMRWDWYGKERIRTEVHEPSPPVPQPQSLTALLEMLQLDMRDRHWLAEDQRAAHHNTWSAFDGRGEETTLSTPSNVFTRFESRATHRYLSDESNEHL